MGTFFLKQSTAVNIQIGSFRDSTDISAENGLTITQADVRLSKNGGAFAQKNNAVSCTFDENGWYLCPLNTTDTGTLGQLLLAVEIASVMPVSHTFQVVTANVYDTLFSTDTFDVNVTAQANIDFGALQKISLNSATPALSTAGVDAILDDSCDSTITVRQALKIILAAVAGKTTVAGTVVNYRDVADSVNRIAATVDTSSMTRTAITLNGA